MADDVFNNVPTVADYENLPTTRLIPVVDVLTWGNTATAEVRAQYELTVTAENESLLRSYHRSLRGCDRVYVQEEPGAPSVWLVPVLENIRLFDTHVGGREVHLLPRFELPPPGPGLPLLNDPIPRRINCRRMLNLEDLRIIRKTFPNSVGVRVLIAGYIIVLFENRKAMEACWQHGVVESIGCQNIGYDIADFRTTSAVAVGCGYAVADRPDEFGQSLGCLGLRLRLPGGKEVITTTTHAFVRLGKRRSSLWLQAAEWYLRLRSSLERFRPIKTELAVPAVAEARDRTGNTPLGKEVWLAGTNRKIGTITATYDPHPSGHLPFPSGFRHDLSLITNENLPYITTPPKTPTISGWGAYTSVLDGEPLFVCRLDVQTGNWRNIEGQGISSAAQAAIAAGSEYTWDRAAFSQNASLLWRTNHDQHRATGFSGSVLCLGHLTDSTAEAVLFQNYEAPLREVHVELDHRTHLPETWNVSFKGGFLLPEEIRASEIIMTPSEFPQKASSMNPQKRTSTDEYRRIVTGPM
ncbi:MAG: hypothetical protein M1816_002464 [Peltula sp. TS41687]|nr:MAG: hypothetical protein M1816_002464 [Peltula sp. TS41687]